MRNNSNGINAFHAHQSRVDNDITFTRSIVEGYTFIGFGTVAKYADERVDVVCGAYTFTNVEVMVFGVDGWGVKPVPDVNDRVLLISSQAPIPDLKKFEAPGSMPSYDVSGLKAIPITDSETAQLITVDKNGVVLTGNNKITINDDGIQVEDNNGNKIVTSSDGVSTEDTNGNKIVTSSNGVSIEDKNGCKIVSSSSSVKINNKLEIKK